MVWTFTTQHKALATIYFGESTMGFLQGWMSPITEKVQNLELTPLRYVLDDIQNSQFAAIGVIGVLITYLGEFNIGFLTGWASPALYSLQSLENTPLHAPLQDKEASIIGGIHVIGAIVVYLGEIAVGFMAGWAAPAITKLQDPEKTPLALVVSDEQAPLLGTLLIVGVIIVYFGEVTVSFLAGTTSVLISKLQNSEESPLPELITDEEASLMGSAIIIGVIIGAQISGYLSNVKGRRICLILGGVTCAAAYLLLAASTELWMLMVGRLFLGVGGGPVYILNLTYIAEVSSKNNRGMFLTGTGVANALGLVFVYSLGPFVSYAVLNYVGLIMNVMFVTGLLFIPETPVFNVMKGKEIEAKKTLLKLGRSEEIEDVLSASTECKKKTCSSLTSIVSTRSNRKAFLIASVLLALQQASGRLCVILFGTSIFKSTGSTISPEIATIGVGLSELVASCLAPLIAARIGRKLLMLFTTAVCCLSMATLGFFFYFKTIKPDIAVELYWLPLLSLVVFLLCYASGFGIVPNTWMSEMLDSNARSPGSAVALSISWVFCFVTASAFGYMTTMLGSHWTFWIYSVSCGLAFIFTAVVVPETTGKTLKEIQIILSK